MYDQCAGHVKRSLRATRSPAAAISRQARETCGSFPGRLRAARGQVLRPPGSSALLAFKAPSRWSSSVSRCLSARRFARNHAAAGGRREPHGARARPTRARARCEAHPDRSAGLRVDLRFEPQAEAADSKRALSASRTVHAPSFCLPHLTWANLPPTNGIESAEGGAEGKELGEARVMQYACRATEGVRDAALGKRGGSRPLAVLTRRHKWA